MKAIFAFATIAAVTVFTFAAHAEEPAVMTLMSGDQEIVILECRREHPIAGLKFDVRLLAGGLAGLTRLEVTEHKIGRQAQVVSYMVTPTQEKKPGAPVEYVSRLATLSINYSVAPRPDHLHHAILTRNQKFTTELLCKHN